MIRHLTLSLAADPIEQVEADVVVVTFFGDDRPLRGNASRVDWRLCGRLSHLLAEDRVSGKVGDAVLVPTLGGMRAPLVIALGLGPARAFDARRCRAAARDAFERAHRLRARSAALALLELGGEEMGIGVRMDALLRGILGPTASDAAGDLESFELQLVSAPEEQPAALEWLRSSRRRGLPAGVEIAVPDREERRPRESPRERPRSIRVDRPPVK